MPLRLLPVLVLLVLSSGAGALSVSDEIDAAQLKQFTLNDPNFVQKYYRANHYVMVCRHKELLALFGKQYGYGACVLVYQVGKKAQLSASGNHFRASIENGQLIALESPREGWPEEDVERLFPWYVRGLIFGSQYAGVEGRVFERAKAEAVAKLGLPLKWP